MTSDLNPPSSYDPMAKGPELARDVALIKEALLVMRQIIERQGARIERLEKRLEKAQADGY